MTAYSYLQMYFAFRIHTFSRRWEYTLVCWLLSLLRFAVAMVALAEDLKIHSIHPSQGECRTKQYVLLVGSFQSTFLLQMGLHLQS